VRVLGISIDPAGGQPRLYGVLLSGSVASPTVEDSFEFRSSDTDPSEQVADLARLLLGKLPGLTFDAAVIRTAGPSPVARRNKAQFSRAHAEGAVLFVLREHLGIPVHTGDPQALAKGVGEKKNDFVARASALSSKLDPTIAALGGLPRT
jgi:hypothetical protein